MIKEFEKQNKNIKRAIRKMLEEAEAIATGEKPAANLDDIFGLDS